MKKIIYLFFVFLSCLGFSESYKYGIIKDSKGYTEVRETSEKNSQIIGKLKNNTLVYIGETKGDLVKISSKVEYYEKKKFVENVEGYVNKDKIIYEFGPIVYSATDGACDNVDVEKIKVENKMNYDDFSRIIYYLENRISRYDFPDINYTVKTATNDEYSHEIKISNGIEMTLMTDMETYITSLKYKKIKINGENTPILNQTVPDTSLLGINVTQALENKNYTYISIPEIFENTGCKTKSVDSVLVFKDNKMNFTFKVIVENITTVREFDKWVNAKEE